MPSVRIRLGLAPALALAALAATAPAALASFAQEASSPIKVGANPYGVVTADFNGDHRQDVAVVNGTSSTVSLLLRRSTGGGFNEETGSPFGLGGGSGPNFAVAADLDHASGPDLAVADYVSGTVSVMLRQPAGGFVVSNVAATRASAVAAGDFNGDGLTDLAAPDYIDGGVTILLGKVGGGYTAAPSAPTGANPRFVVARDFTGDGKPDLAVTNSGASSVTILRGTGTGGFVAEGTPIAVGTTPYLLASADFDGNGRPDLAVANYGSDTVTILLRNATGTGFVREGSPIAVGDGPIGIASGDFDSDGHPDLAIANNIGKSVTVLLRRGAGFAPDPSSPIRTDRGAYSLAVADFDGDGRPDLAVSNDGTGELTVLLNSTPRPPSTTPPPTTPPPGSTGPTRLHVRVVGSWAVSDAGVLVGKLSVKGLRAGAKVKLRCRSCHVRQTLKARGSKVVLKKLGGRVLARGKGFTLTVTLAGAIGDQLTMTVKRYGHTSKAFTRAALDPFVKRHRCLPVGSAKPAKTCS